ncbi:nucleoside deaminase [Nocardia sp. NPDC057227]|uniref:nucleoside deaminase n=1 Tax=Nocardia sp. NPDC057227 TaxID=3346056 RepID=UPI00363270E1
MGWSRADLTALMGDAVTFGVQHVERGGIPFVGVVVGADGYVSPFGVNRVRETGDPTAHAEIVAIRDTIRARQTTDLTAYSLLATGEPCGICYRFALDHGIGTIYVAVPADEVAALGFDYRSSYAAARVDRAALAGSTVVPLTVPDGLAPFHRFLAVN